MALVDTPNLAGIQMASTGLVNALGSTANLTINAAGESATGIGKICLSSGPGTSKTISSSGGSIYWRATSATFANAGTNLRIGVQDVGATGIEDGTFDVYADLVGGTDTITNSVLIETPMETGSKTITHGDLIAVSLELTTLGGADTIAINFGSLTGQAGGFSITPYITSDSGSGPTKNATVAPIFVIKFDDGTLGWFYPSFGPLLSGSTNLPSITYSNASSPDEYAAVFQIPFKARVGGASINMGAIASTDNLDIVFYADPLGTPSVQQTVTIDPNMVSATSTGTYWIPLASMVLSPNTNYALAVRPTTANSIAIQHIDFTSVLGSGLKAALPFGTSLKLAGRTDQTGAFTEVQPYYAPVFSLMFDQLDDGTSTGGTTIANPTAVIGG